MKTKFTLLILSILFINNISKAQLSGYTFAKSITVSNSSAITAVNYQIRLTINTQILIAASQMQANGNDIRFGKTCNGSTLYKYWIESGINTPTTVIWVKIDTILSGTDRTFFMFHGNSGAGASSSIPLVFSYAGSSTDSVSGGTSGGSINSQRGFRFSPNVDILVTSLGKNEPNGTDRYVTLFDNTSTSIIAQQQVSGPLGVYSYSALPNPIWLTHGAQYVIQLYQGATDGYYYGSSTQIDSRLTLFDMKYCNSCTQNTFPTNTLAGMHYGYADFLFYYRNMVSPEPTYVLGSSVIPIITAITNNSLICLGGSSTLTASGASSYAWNTGSTNSVIVVTPTSTTTYSVVGQSSIGCLASTIITQSVSICASVNSISQGGLQYNIFPNPTSGILNIDLENINERNSKIQITNVMGQIIISENINSKHLSFNMQNFSAGIYFVKIIENDHIIATQKIVKQ
jgi:hypothetical protein